MDVRRLEVFLSVVGAGSFTAAGNALSISQPAVSQAVRELEEDLGALLFHRLGRSVKLTAAGEALVISARQALRDLDIGRMAVEEVNGLATGSLELAAIPTLAVAPLAPLVGAFRTAHPGVSIRLADPTNTGALLELVRSGAVEIGLVDVLEAAGLVAVPLLRQEFKVVMGPGKVATDPFAAADLGDLPLVATPPGSALRAVLDEACVRARVTPVVAVEVAQREALVPVIVSGAGAAILPAPLAAVAERLGCTVVDLRPSVEQNVALVHRDAAVTPAGRSFISLAHQYNK
jgi:DNA-binding transcriptional LysR family regulator